MNRTAECDIRVAGYGCRSIAYQMLVGADGVCVVFVSADEPRPVDGYVLDGAIVLRDENSEPFAALLSPPSQALCALSDGYGIFFAAINGDRMVAEGLVKGVGYGEKHKCS